MAKESFSQAKESTSPNRRNTVFSRLLRTTDYRNPKIWNQLRASKESLFQNMQDKTVLASDVNTIFWIYTNIDKDIPKQLSSRLARYSLKVDDENMSVSDYLTLLGSVKMILDPIKHNYQTWKKIAQRSVDQQDKDPDNTRTEYEFDQYVGKINIQLRALYTKNYTPALLQQQANHVLLGLKNRTANFMDIVQYLVLDSLTLHGSDQTLIDLTPYLDQPIECWLDAPIQLKHILSLLSALDFDGHVFAVT